MCPTAYLKSACCANNARGWRAFRCEAATKKDAGAFGGDDTQSMVPRQSLRSIKVPRSLLTSPKSNNYKVLREGMV